LTYFIYKEEGKTKKGKRRKEGRPVYKKEEGHWEKKTAKGKGE